jgi:hypothetical protein
MAKSIKGNQNLHAGRDIILGRPSDRFVPDGIGELFKTTDRLFREIISGSGVIYRKNTPIEFSSEALFSSLIVIGIPVQIAIEVPAQIIHLLKTLIEYAEEDFELTTNNIRAAVLQVLTGLQFRPDSFTADEVSTWCSAYVRRYGSGSSFLQVIDNGIEVELNYEYIKQKLLPHVLERVLGLEKGQDAVGQYKYFFSSHVMAHMAKEIIRFINTLNLYSIQYKTLYFLVRDTMLQPPHPWIVNEATMEIVLRYNLERASFHYKTIFGQFTEASPALFIPSARECCVHLCAAILSYYGCLLGIESRYGLGELMRVIQLKLYQTNVPMWNYCRLYNLEADLSKKGMSLSSFHNFLARLNSSLYPQLDGAEAFARAKENCGLLLQYTETLLDRKIHRA